MPGLSLDRMALAGRNQTTNSWRESASTVFLNTMKIGLQEKFSSFIKGSKKVYYVPAHVSVDELIPYPAIHNPSHVPGPRLLHDAVDTQ
jgi:hypothetical protein